MKKLFSWINGLHPTTIIAIAAVMFTYFASMMVFQIIETFRAHERIGYAVNGCLVAIYLYCAFEQIRHIKRKQLEIRMFQLWLHQQGKEELAEHLKECPSCRKLMNAAAAAREAERAAESVTLN